MIRVGVLLAALLGSLCALADVTALVGGTVLDGTGGPPLRNAAVVIDGERIVAVGPVATTPIPDGATRISTEGMTVLPGLWDLAVNLMRLGHASERRWNEQYVPLAERVVMPLSAAELLAAGVTSARDIGAPPGAATSVRERIRSLRIDGPTLYVAGPRLTMDPDPGAGAWQWAVADAADAKARVDALAAAGVDYILLADLDRWVPAALTAAVAAARERALPVQAYVRRAAEIEPALAAGVDGFAGDGPATALADGVMLALRQRASTPGYRPFIWVPAIAAVMNFESLRMDPEPLDDPRLLANAPRVIVQDVLASLASLDGVTWYDLPSTRRSNQCAKLAQLRDAGLTVLIGSNAGAPAQFPRSATGTEIVAWVRDCHVAPELAIRAATLDAAFAMGAAGESGSLTPGKYADVIAVYGDVLRQVERLAEPVIVIRRGRRYR